MTTKPTQHQGAFISCVVSSTGFFIPLAYVIIWIIIFLQLSDHASRVAAYQDLMWNFDADPREQAKILLLMCLTAIVAAFLFFKQKPRWMKIYSKVIVVLSSLLVWLLLFSLL